MIFLGSQSKPKTLRLSKRYLNCFSFLAEKVGWWFADQDRITPQQPQMILDLKTFIWDQSKKNWRKWQEKTFFEIVK
jgi:hypothetical protein